MNILVVDDNPANRLLLKYMIESNGYSVDEAEDGIYSVDMVKEKEYDLIFMDMMMPKMNGYVATKNIKEINPNIPIYIVSAYQKVDFPADWQCVDYEDVLSKPVSMETIVQILNKHNI
jgi:CheY-like chemotaxis protein